MSDVKIGYAAALEQFGPKEMIDLCETAERHGFVGTMAADHFQPWVPQQGQASYVWNVLSAVGQRTSGDMGPGVTCPSFRHHPAIVAQAAATLEAMYPGRFWLGLGAGEALNEHIIGEYWPEAPARLERLQESIEVIRQLWTGKV
ncbi:MAG: LLM class flavin-dependent oxidoreductase, partial [Propionibacteriales bacterium]|nr:LLM class flavin-dependent oxidoreductase [Propionibacteriales bacterium]